MNSYDYLRENVQHLVSIEQPAPGNVRRCNPDPARAPRRPGRGRHAAGRLLPRTVYADTQENAGTM